MFYDVKGMQRPLGGWSIPLERVLRRLVGQGWFWNLLYSREYRTNLISRLVEADHPEACFKAGLVEVFVKHRGIVTPRVEML
jgi:hypothetical protein